MDPILSIILMSIGSICVISFFVGSWKSHYHVQGSNMDSCFISHGPDNYTIRDNRVNNLTGICKYNADACFFWHTPAYWGNFIRTYISISCSNTWTIDGFRAWYSTVTLSHRLLHEHIYVGEYYFQQLMGFYAVRTERSRQEDNYNVG